MPIFSPTPTPTTPRASPAASAQVGAGSGLRGGGGCGAGWMDGWRLAQLLRCCAMRVVAPGAARWRPAVAVRVAVADSQPACLAARLPAWLPECCACPPALPSPRCCKAAGPLICSPITARVLRHDLNLRQDCLRILEPDCPVLICGVGVLVVVGMVGGCAGIGWQVGPPILHAGWVASTQLSRGWVQTVEQQQARRVMPL